MRIEDKIKFKVIPAPNGNGVANNNNNDNNNTAPPSPTIHECAESGDLVAFQTLLLQNPSLLNDPNPTWMQTPLHVAATNNRVEIVKYLLVWAGLEKTDLEAKDIYGETALHMAAKNGFSETARMLLNYGANIEAKTNNAMTPLHLAVGFTLRTGDSSIVKTLCDYNANCFARDDEGLTPVNYLPEGIQDHELLSLLCQTVAQQIQNGTHLIYNAAAGVQNVVDDQSNYGNTSIPTYHSGGDPANYEIKAKMDEFNEELSKFVGLHELKQQLQKWAKGMLLDEKRRAMGYNLGPRKLPHMAFLGNPGTGKTTIARILGKLLKSVGVLSSDKVTEVQRSDLVAEYLGQTGPKTRRKIDEAMGGILFVDEAYRLAPQQREGEHVDFGVEAMEEIMSVLEDGELVVVFAGYTEPMNRVFSSNEGFCRRVTHFFQFDNFSCKDMTEMLLIKMKKQSEKSRLYGFKLHPACTYEAVLRVIEENSTEKLRNKMNGGVVDHMLNSARENLDSRLTFYAKEEELLTIMLQDLEAGLKAVTQRVKVD